jgi:hypothetical protein
MKTISDDYAAYRTNDKGILVVPHQGDWRAYYRLGDECDLILIAF